MRALWLSVSVGSWVWAFPVTAAAQDAAETHGIPVVNEEVRASCGSCHRVDGEGRMGRISEIRKTPEGWQRSLLRMISLQGVQVEPEAARRIVRYLSNQHGLAPDELRPTLWEVERRTVPNEAPNEIIRETCTACHSVGRVLTQHRTPEEWRLLTETHRAYYPLIDNQIYRDGADGEPHPVDEAIAYLAEANPLMTPAWSAWSSGTQAPRLAGTWALEGEEVGRGEVFGRVEIEAVEGTPDEFTTRATYTYPRDGRTVVREGEIIVYTGYQWRGRSDEVESGAASEVGADGELREVMFVEPDLSEVRGRWFRGAYDELGLDVRLRPVDADPVLLGTYPRALRRSDGEVEVQVYGAVLPSSPIPEAIDPGPGLEVLEVVDGDSEGFRVRIGIDPGATPGPRPLALGRAVLPEAFIVYDEVARLEVEPSLGMARVGGANLPVQYERFEAIGYGTGADGRAGTADDPRLGPVEVEWRLEEYPARFDEDDVQFVGELEADGVFHPALDGPNPGRDGDRNNIGDVWAHATFSPPDGEGRALEARGQLIVTVPLYLRWELSGMTDDLTAGDGP